MLDDDFGEDLAFVKEDGFIECCKVDQVAWYVGEDFD
jgi:hypothetical protein